MVQVVNRFRESLVKYESPILVSEKNGSENTKLSSSQKKPSKKIVDQVKSNSQVEEILNSIIPPKYYKHLIDFNPVTENL
jgi:hypothetical protein